MAAIKYSTARYFLGRTPKRDSSAFYSTGSALYSYGMRLAHWTDEGPVVDFVDRWDGGPYPPSQTTGAHMRAASIVWEHPDARYFSGASCCVYPRTVRGKTTYRPERGRIKGW